MLRLRFDNKLATKRGAYLENLGFKIEGSTKVM
jgi:hypothetical protein